MAPMTVDENDLLTHVDKATDVYGGGYSATKVATKQLSGGGTTNQTAFGGIFADLAVPTLMASYPSPATIQQGGYTYHSTDRQYLSMQEPVEDTLYDKLLKMVTDERPLGKPVGSEKKVKAKTRHHGQQQQSKPPKRKTRKRVQITLTR